MASACRGACAGAGWIGVGAGSARLRRLSRRLQGPGEGGGVRQTVVRLVVQRTRQQLAQLHRSVPGLETVRLTNFRAVVGQTVVHGAG